jgi:hypothetical protein
MRERELDGKGRTDDADEFHTGFHTDEFGKEEWAWKHHRPTYKSNV